MDAICPQNKSATPCVNLSIIVTQSELERITGNPGDGVLSRIRAKGEPRTSDPHPRKAKARQSRSRPELASHDQSQALRNIRQSLDDLDLRPSDLERLSQVQDRLLNPV